MVSVELVWDKQVLSVETDRSSFFSFRLWRQALTQTWISLGIFIMLEIAWKISAIVAFEFTLLRLWRIFLKVWVLDELLGSRARTILRVCKPCLLYYCFHKAVPCCLEKTTSVVNPSNPHSFSTGIRFRAGCNKHHSRFIIHILLLIGCLLFMT